MLTIIKHCIAGNIDEAYAGLKQLYDLGYSASDIITTLFRVVKNYEMVEFLKLEYIRVSFVVSSPSCLFLGEEEDDFCPLVHWFSPYDQYLPLCFFLTYQLYRSGVGNWIIN